MAQLEHITPDQIAQYGVVAAPDRLTGRAQDNKAIFDRLVRELVALVVNDIIDRTNELLIAEDTREENEADRIAAENLRVQAENLRVQAENIRVENEQSRVQAEASRVAAELLRVQAESLRVSAEQSRVSAEAEREAAEALRESTTSGIVVRATEQAEAAERSATRALNAEQGASNYERAAGESAANAAAFSQNAKNFASDAESSSADAEASAIAAAESVKRSPYIDPNKKTWFVWDSNTGAFVDTGIVAEGKNGIEADGLWGVYVDEEGFLVVTYTGDDPPPLSISDDGYLVYTLNGQEIRVGKTVGPVGPVGPAGLGVPEATPEDADKIPIVAPDGTYKLGYQSGAIDDTKAQTDKTWSSLTIVDRLAPTFETSGPAVICNPVQGYPLHVVSQIVPVQSGSGDPSPENVRPISGWDAASLWAGGGNLAQNPESGAYKDVTMTKVDDPTKARIPTLMPLLEEKGEGYPSFMTSQAWQQKSLETFAGSFTELKHDTVLYAKQVMAEMGGDYIEEVDDRGYVEPEPEVFRRFYLLAQQTAEGLDKYGLINDEDKENLFRLAQLAKQLQTISEKELRNETLTDEEYELIRTYGGNLEHFWIEAVKDKAESDYLETQEIPASLVTDIATDPNGTVLQIANAMPQEIVVVVPVDGTLRLASGAVYDFYQFTWPMEQRLTDTQWRQMIGEWVGPDGNYNWEGRDSLVKPTWTESYRSNSW